MGRDSDPQGWTERWVWLGDAVVLFMQVPITARILFARAEKPPGVRDIVVGLHDVAIYLVSPDVPLPAIMAFAKAIDHAQCGTYSTAYSTAESTAHRRDSLGSGIGGSDELNASSASGSTATHLFKVRYGGSGTDLQQVASQLAVSESEVIRLHTANAYTVLSTGFAPGFAYCGSIHKDLQLARKKVPSLDVGAGAVAIAMSYTGIYPRASAGGWWILGYLTAEQTTALWRFERAIPGLLQIGDRVQFVTD